MVGEGQAGAVGGVQGRPAGADVILKMAAGARDLGLGAVDAGDFQTRPAA